MEVAEVWAVGYRKDNEVYEEIEQRVANAGSSPKTKALTEVLELFAKRASDLTATPEPEKPEPVPRWLTDALLYVVPPAPPGPGPASKAERAWTDHISGAGSGTWPGLLLRLPSLPAALIAAVAGVQSVRDSTVSSQFAEEDESR